MKSARPGVAAIALVVAWLGSPLAPSAAGPSSAGHADLGVTAPALHAKRPRFDEPNIIVVYTDDQRWDTLGVMPQVSRLAEEGVTFVNGFTTSPVCGPSRASLLTGRLASTLGIDLNEGASGQLDPSDTIAVRLQQRGYATALFGKYLNGYRDQFPTVPPGWTEWRVLRDRLSDLFGAGSLYEDPVLSWNGTPRRVTGYSTDLLADYTLEFIEQNAERPFFVLLSVFAPHVPFVRPDRHKGLLSGMAPPAPPSLGEEDLADKPAWIRDLASEADVGAFWETYLPAYLELLLSVDEAVGAIRSKLEELEIDRDTIIVFTSDNGFLFGEHWVLGKGVPYEESIRVPLVVWNPRLEHRVVEEMVLNIDVAPTLLELAGGRMESDGRSFLPLLLGSPTRWRHFFPIESETGFGTPVNFRAIRSKLFKFVEWEGGHRELYFLPLDPFEEEGLRLR